MVFGGIAVGMVAFGIAVAGRRYLGWAVASATVAVLIEPAVRWLDRRLPRALAVIVAFLAIGAVAGGVTFGVLHDLGNQIERLRVEAPAAARRLEGSERFGDLARDFHLVERVDDAVAELRDPASGVGQRAVSSAGTYFLCFILTVSLIGAVPGLIRSAIAQIPDEERRSRVERMVAGGFTRAQSYIVWAIALALGCGLLAWGMFQLVDVPAPLALGVTVAAASFVPGMGVLAGAVPALLLEAGLGTAKGTVLLLVAMALLQVAHQQVLRRFVTPRTLVVGPAVIVISVVLGYEVYGIGGAAYTAALAVFAVSALDVGGALQGKGRHAITPT